MPSRKWKQEQMRLRELASQTLDAYRELNSAAAEVSFKRNGPPDADGLARASKLLEGVLAEIKRTVTSSATV